MILENEYLRLECCTKGGEIQSCYDKTKQREIMWQGDSQYWSGKNPTLFPIVGNTFSKTYEINGQTYAMKNHGLIRYGECTLVNQTENSLTLQMKSDSETLKQYPFDFTYEITYTLKGKRVEITYHITNDSKVTMPFTFGLHPGFNITDPQAKVVYAVEEHVNQIHFAQGYSKEAKTMKEWTMSHEEIAQEGTLIYENLSSPYVDLVQNVGTLRVSIAGYPYLALWCAPNAPFLCIEPWYGMADLVEEMATDFDKRVGMMELSPNKTFTTSYWFEVKE